jgi:hypothetical protein
MGFAAAGVWRLVCLFLSASSMKTHDRNSTSLTQPRRTPCTASDQEPDSIARLGEARFTAVPRGSRSTSKYAPDDVCLGTGGRCPRSE